MKVLVTGATGFIGSRLCSYIKHSRDWQVIGLGRTPPAADVEANLSSFVTADLANPFQLEKELRGVDVVVHLASRVHRKEQSEHDDRYSALNVSATRSLAEQAALAGVKRFVFISTIKVNGERTFEKPFCPQDPPAPHDGYARSKYEAERILLDIASRTSMEVVILRPALVYGPGVRANFLSLMRLAARGWPLPFGSIENRRSLIYVDNLCDAITVSTVHPAAAGRVFTIVDDMPVSTAALVRQLSLGMGFKPRIWHMPISVLKFAAFLLGRSWQISRLVDSLEADSLDFKRETGWRPLISSEDGLAATARWYSQTLAIETGAKVSEMNSVPTPASYVMTATPAPVVKVASAIVPTESSARPQAGQVQ